MGFSIQAAYDDGFTHGHMEAKTEISQLKERIAKLERQLQQIHDIAIGSTTANSLPHIAKIAVNSDGN